MERRRSDKFRSFIESKNGIHEEQERTATIEFQGRESMEKAVHGAEGNDEGNVGRARRLQRSQRKRKWECRKPAAKCRNPMSRKSLRKRWPERLHDTVGETGLWGHCQLENAIGSVQHPTKTQ